VGHEEAQVTLVLVSVKRCWEQEIRARQAFDELCLCTSCFCLEGYEETG
jgi:hypothetical protein